MSTAISGPGLSGLLSLLFCLAGCGGEGPLPVVDLTDTRPAGESPPVLSASAGQTGEFLFGFDPRSGPQEDARQYQPLLDYLGRTTGYRFRLDIAGKERSTADALGANRVQFAAIGAAGAVRAQELHGAAILVQGLNADGKSTYRAMIVVAPDSPLRDLADLRGKRLAFGSIDSTQGHVIPRLMLEQRGIGLKDLKSVAYTGSHRDCANAVLTGKADACGMQDTMARSLAAEGQVRILATSGDYPSSGIAAGPKVPPEVVERVRRALLVFDPQGRDRAGLYHWERTEMPRGFTAPTPAALAELRDGLLRLGLMRGTPGKDG